jgi:hypothetical protein
MKATFFLSGFISGRGEDLNFQLRIEDRYCYICSLCPLGWDEHPTYYRFSLIGKYFWGGKRKIIPQLLHFEDLLIIALIAPTPYSVAIFLRLSFALMWNKHFISSLDSFYTEFFPCLILWFQHVHVIIYFHTASMSRNHVQSPAVVVSLFLVTLVSWQFSTWLL